METFDGIQYAELRKQWHHHSVLMFRRIDLEVQNRVHARYLAESKRSACITRCQVIHDSIFGSAAQVIDVDGHQKLHLQDLASKFDDGPPEAQPKSINEKFFFFILKFNF